MPEAETIRKDQLFADLDAAFRQGAGALHPLDRELVDALIEGFIEGLPDGEPPPDTKRGAERDGYTYKITPGSSRGQMKQLGITFAESVLAGARAASGELLELLALVDGVRRLGRLIGKRMRDGVGGVDFSPGAVLETLDGVAPPGLTVREIVEKVGFGLDETDVVGILHELAARDDTARVVETDGRWHVPGFQD